MPLSRTRELLEFGEERRVPPHDDERLPPEPVRFRAAAALVEEDGEKIGRARLGPRRRRKLQHEPEERLRALVVAEGELRPPERIDHLEPPARFRIGGIDRLEEIRALPESLFRAKA